MSAIDQEQFSGEAIYSHPTEKHRRSFIISESKELFFAKPPVILSLIKKTKLSFEFYIEHRDFKHY